MILGNAAWHFFNLNMRLYHLAAGAYSKFFITESQLLLSYSFPYNLFILTHF